MVFQFHFFPLSFYPLEMVVIIVISIISELIVIIFFYYCFVVFCFACGFPYLKMNWNGR